MTFQRDRRSTAYQEAGHIVFYRALSFDAWGRKWWTGKAPTVEEKCVNGQVKYFCFAPKTLNSVISWAGPFDVDVSELSPTDQDAIGADEVLAEDAFYKSKKMVEDARNEIEREARRLIRTLPTPEIFKPQSKKI